MKVRVIQMINNELTHFETTTENLITFMLVHGYAHTGFNDHNRQRPELRGQPRFQGMCGPAWDGDAIRYECPQSYAQLST